MNRLKTTIARTKSLISIKTYKRPQVYVILLMLLINIIILLIAAFIATIIDSSYTSFIDALTNGSVKWMLTPNAILQIENPQTLVLAVVVLVIGMVLFTGVIIALTTNAIKDYVGNKKSGSGKVFMENHIVILNWNSKVPELVSDLLFVESSDVTVMILAQVDKTYAESQIINAINRSAQKHKLVKMNVLVKQGDPLLRSNLDDISVEHAKALLIMNPDQHDKIDDTMTKSDLNVIKNILSLGEIEFDLEPPIVVEIKKIETKEKILTLSRVVKSLKEHEIMPIVFDRRLGQIIAQTLIESKIEDVYLSLFSFKGSEIYSIPNPDIENILKDYNQAIPVAHDANATYVLSPNDVIKNSKSAHLYQPIELKLKKVKSLTDFDTYIIGTNNKLNFILDALMQYESIYKNKFHSSYVESSEIPGFVDKLNTSSRSAKILLLSDENVEFDALDANIINTLIYLEGHITNPHVEIIVELLNPKNDIIVRGFNINNTIISNKIISLLLSKLALFKETAPFYEDLLTIEADDSNIDRQSIAIVKAKDFIDAQFPIRFESKKQAIESLYLKTNPKQILIGIFRDQALLIIDGDLHKEKFEIREDDECVLITI
ncbi:MAG: hypothetical protein PHW37_02025 [Acholeplasmataceae bacterium]|nr:hypothetical protein [Acholeplasmataceae bacterium]MDD4194027.1 hypothetical protein [Acholeplasmataceae bacterium]